MKFSLLFFAAGTMVMMYLMSASGKALKTPASPHGILDLEFAYNVEKATAVTHAWKYHDGINRTSVAKNNTYLDFLFLLCYAPFLFMCCKALIAKDKRYFIRKAGNVIAKGALVAGVLDVLENLGMLQTLNGNSNDTIALFTFTASIIKWALVSIAILFILFGLIRKLFTQHRYSAPAA